VHRFVKAWRDEHTRVPVHAYVPMSFAPRGSLPVRLEPRDDHASRVAADDQSGAHEAVAQPHAVCTCLFS
jgi:hypothetical protein